MGLFPFAPRYDRAAEIHLYGAPGFAGELARLIGSSNVNCKGTEGRPAIGFSR